MKLHEYQAKKILAEYHLPVPTGVVLQRLEDIETVFKEIPKGPWVVKAQVHAGGRGKAGGIRIVETEELLQEAVRSLLHSQLITAQTDAKGQPIHTLLIEKKASIVKELYLGMLIDRSSQRLTCIVSPSGGMDIEAVAKNNPSQIIQLPIDPLLGIRSYQARQLGYHFGLDEAMLLVLIPMMQNLEKLFIERDLSLLEINPLVVTADKQLVCMDAKMVVDDNALYRQLSLKAMEDASQDNIQEQIAKECGLSYIALEGDIGCMVNGAGLAMATMDLIQLQGGSPANFLDIGGTADQERVKTAFEILLSASGVKAILVNIFGGIVRCDVIATGIIESLKAKNMRLPIIVRLEGNAAERADEILRKSGLNITPAHSLLEATQLAVRSVRNT